MKYSNMLHQTEDKSSNIMAQKEVQSNSTARIAVILSIVTLILSAIIIPSLIVLHTEYVRLKSEIMSQKELMLSYTNGRNDLSLEINGYSETDILNREKRSDGGKKNRNRSNKRKQHNKKKSSRSSQSGTEVIHLEIDASHELALKGEEVKTPERGGTIPFWKFSDTDFNHNQNFATLDTPDGTISILKSGMYFIYSQMTYYDRSGRWSHRIDIGDEPFIKCLASEWGIETDPDTGLHYNTIHQCYSAAVTYITRDKVVTMKAMYPNRTIHPDSDMSFWGIIKLT